MRRKIQRTLSPYTETQRDIFPQFDTSQYIRTCYIMCSLPYTDELLCCTLAFRYVEWQQGSPMAKSDSHPLKTRPRAQGCRRPLLSANKVHFNAGSPLQFIWNYFQITVRLMGQTSLNTEHTHCTIIGGSDTHCSYLKTVSQMPDSSNITGRFLSIINGSCRLQDERNILRLRVQLSSTAQIRRDGGRNTSVFGPYNDAGY